jgi:membrane-bound metal-dependent hydrolase YbcI (DUF457 family)
VQGPSHLLVSWYLGDALALRTARERRIVAWAGFAPDVDVLAYIGALAYYRLDKDLAFENVWQVVHHRYTHNLSFVLLVGAIAWWLAPREQGGSTRRPVALYAMLACALHNFLDLVAGGPTWPIYPLWPFSGLAWAASWSWTIGEWPNLVVLFACLAGMFAYARFAGRSPMECFGTGAERWWLGVVNARADLAPSAGSRRLRWIIWAALALLVLAVLAPLRTEL